MRVRVGARARARAHACVRECYNDINKYTCGLNVSQKHLAPFNNSDSLH